MGLGPINILVVLSSKFQKIIFLIKLKLENKEAAEAQITWLREDPGFETLLHAELIARSYTCYRQSGIARTAC